MKSSTGGQCIAAHAATWRMTEVYPTHYEQSRRYSRFAQSLLRFFAVHRTATADQVQRYFPDELRSARSARMHLQTLAKQRDLQVLRTRGMGGTNIYLITLKGFRSLALREGYPAPRRRHSSGNHLSHEILNTEVAVLLQNCLTKEDPLLVPWQERFTLCRHPCFRDLVPDYAFLMAYPRGQLVHFVEVSSGEDSTARLRAKLVAYANWSETEAGREFLLELYRSHGAAQPQPHFRILFVMHHRLGLGDEFRVGQLLQAAAAAPTATRRRLWCSTATSLAGAVSLNDPIWLRVADLDSCFTDQDSVATREFHRRLITAAQSLPHHMLFPKG